MAQRDSVVAATYDHERTRHTDGTSQRVQLPLLPRTLMTHDNGSTLPVKTTGFPRFSSMNDMADDAYAIVSVPMMTTNAST